MTRSNRVGTVAWAIAMAVATPASPPAGTAGPPAAPWSHWRTLSFEARPLPFFDGRFQMDVREADGQRLLETRTRARFLGIELARSRSRTTIDVASGRTLAHYELSRKRGRRYVFDDEGYAVERLRPRRSSDDPIDEWEVMSSERFPYPTAEDSDGGRPRVFDYYGLILHLKDAPLDRPGDTLTAWVATSRGPKPFVIRVTDGGTTERTFRDLTEGRDRTLSVREFRLRISPADPFGSDTGFMKMEGDTEIRVEADTRTVLEIDGRIPHVPGRVELALKTIG